jgi:predicted neuraminidase
MKRNYSTSVVNVITCLVLSNAASAATGIVQEGFVFESAPHPECHASTIESTPSGLVAAWFGGTEEKNPDVGIWLARQIDGQWQAPGEVANGIQYTRPDGTVHRQACWNPVLFLPRKGPLLLFYKCGPTPRTWWGMLISSTDHGKTWSQPRRLPEGILGPVRCKPIQLASGEILCGSSTEHDGWRVHFERTADLGRTWKRIGPLENTPGDGAIQPTILTHADGRLQILCRTESGKGTLAQSWSSDRGTSWSPLGGTALPNPSAGVDVVSLRDGRHLLVYNHTVRGSAFPKSREMINVAVSRDGREWQAALILDRERGAEFSYPAAIQTADGLVHVTYTWNRDRIKHVVLDPAKIELREIKAGQWPD